ncbi:hypothetical protein SAMN05444166_4181 [Singulisphaera sp. GP187]|uniref:hypothetical protein n=1 Tax=Singulisphaera sp. GP187 TaxID=1882752 RepID=UPI0009271613|nr:hypothetical protein [Singulisphaera sp. GP187]SIO37295.1 hypothetical protein SAMN05444166_4181 [Singulisphaera sp. GP187]
MPRPFVLIQIEDHDEPNTMIVGDTQIITILVNWADANQDPYLADELIDEIKGRYHENEEPDGVVQEVLNKLKEAARDEDEDEEDEDDFDEDEDEEEDDEDLVDELEDEEAVDVLTPDRDDSEGLDL